MERADTIYDLKQRGAGMPAPERVRVLYHQAFAEFGAQALWNRKPSDRPSVAQALTVAESLRREGDLRSRALAVRIEEGCSAAL